MLDFPLTMTAPPEAAGQRLDQFLATQLSEVSRARVQHLIAKGEVLVNGAAAKASQRLKGNGEEQITVTGPPHAPPLRAIMSTDELSPSVGPFVTAARINSR